MKVIIAGGRDFNDYALMKRKLDHLFSKRMPDEIVSGNARGADALGERYAKEHSIDLKLFPANWSEHGRAAGHIRNAEMANYGTHLVAFWDKRSRGTLNMIETAKKKGLNVRVVYY
ncbi:MAG: hypothetical protein Tp1111DCM1126091_30 [Prokaryotic dsDNA virus sp.]|nr:MAG: hypothetical protein Tp1111DCM1126091_30 [Prokaryotic dsDNA virus sp.]